VNKRIFVGWLIAIVIGSLVGSYVCYAMCRPCKEFVTEMTRPVSTPRTINKYVFIKDEPPAWPTPYPDDMTRTNISQEGCEEYRYPHDKLSPRMLLMWDENSDELIDSYELLEFIYEAVSSTVASHNCSIYESGYRFQPKYY